MKIRYTVGIVIYSNLLFATCGTLLPNKGLNSGESLYSCNRQYRLRLNRHGNLVVYGPTGATWSTVTGPIPSFFLGGFGQNDRGNKMILQGDGNLVLFNNFGTSLQTAPWYSATFGFPNSNLVMQDDGNLVIYSGNGVPLWSSKTDILILPGTDIGASGGSGGHLTSAVQRHDSGLPCCGASCSSVTSNPPVMPFIPDLNPASNHSPDWGPAGSCVCALLGDKCEALSCFNAIMHAGDSGKEPAEVLTEILNECLATAGTIAELTCHRLAPIVGQLHMTLAVLRCLYGGSTLPQLATDILNSMCNFDDPFDKGGCGAGNIIQTMKNYCARHPGALINPDTFCQTTFMGYPDPTKPKGERCGWSPAHDVCMRSCPKIAATVFPVTKEGEFCPN